MSKVQKQKFNNILTQISSTDTKEVKSKLKHVETVVKHKIDLDDYRGENKPYPFDFYHETPRFDVNDPLAYKYLEEHGYVVIKNVISSQSEIDSIKEMMWDWLESIDISLWPKWWTKKRIEEEIAKNPEKYSIERKIDRNNIDTWEWFPTDPGSGIVFGYGVGQTNFQWKIRSNKNVQKAFSNIWNTNDLITSFDGCNFYRPWRYNNKWKTNGKWWHVDQNAKNPESIGKQSVQGLVALIDCDETVGGLCVIPKTHLIHNKLCNRIDGFGTNDFVSIPVSDPLWDEYPEGGVLVRCKAGDLCLWDSRTVHCNSPAIDAPNTTMMSGKDKIKRNFLIKNKNKAKLANGDGNNYNNDEKSEEIVENEKPSKWDLIRMTCYVCMTPRYKATNETLLERQKAFNKHSHTSHWPHKLQICSKSRYFVDHTKQLYDGKPFTELNENQQRLVGIPRTEMEEFLWKSQYNLSSLINFSDVWMAGNLVLGGFVVWSALTKK